ncbi:G5 and 3D domain-containing protein [Oceanobacillus halotolerans]|uniref:G5 and 3D domain-containing protein n=1 Tax=Oceanobacillus halotolerans TaxID=2663380 RepID=UPI0013D44C53|nr:G5 and 3D domain-containing protein [Oceanobacillus halotolerans]
MKFISKLLSKQKFVISGIGVLALVVFSSIVIVQASKVEVTLIDNGEAQTVKTASDTVEELLKEEGIDVGEHDAISHDPEEPIESGMEIDYKTAKQVTVTIDDEEQVYYTTVDTIEAFLKENNLTVSDYDDVSHDVTDDIEDGLQLTIDKAFEVTIKNGTKEKYNVWTTGGTVKELLAEEEINIDEDLDKVDPGLKKTVKQDDLIKIVRVEKEEVEVEEAVAFETERKNDDSIEKGKEQVITQGQEGKVKKVYEITKENGEEVNRELVKEEVIQESKNRVVAVGTKEPKQNLKTLSSSNSNESGSGKTMTMHASAYTASCGGCSGYTATGINLKANPNKKVVAVDPNVIPLGSRVWVEGYGEAIAGDTGGNINGKRVDLHFPSKSAAYSFGSKTVKVKVLD